MKLLGAKEVAEGTGVATKGIKGVGTATRKTSGESSKAAKVNSVLTKSYGALGRAAKYGLGILGVSGVFALQSAVHSTTELAKTTVGLSRNLGISTKAASRWGAVAQAREIDTKSLNTAFATLSSHAVEAGRKGGSLLTSWHQLGIGQQELTKHAGNFNWTIMRTAKALGEEKGGTVRMTAAKALLGKGYQSLLPLFSEGVKGLKEQLHWTDKYGGALSNMTEGELMKFVQSQRESKIAMQALKTTLTVALLPALEGGEEQLQQFIKTLNSPKMSGAEKITAIQGQFEGLENTLIEVISQALPKVAESGGKLGLALAGAVWEGFVHSNLLGKLVISAWLIHFMGGGELIRVVAGKVGNEIVVGLAKTLVPGVAAELAAGSTLGQIFETRFKALGITSGRAFTIGVVAGVALLGVYVGTQIYNHLSNSTKKAMHDWAWTAGENFVNTLIDAINKGLDESNALAFMGIEAPEIGHVNWHHGHNSLEQQRGQAKNAIHHGMFDGPGGKLIPAPGGKSGKKTPRPSAAPRRNFADMLEQHFHLYIDGKEVSLAVARHANRAAARA
jgi:hypothetical protein